MMEKNENPRTIIEKLIAADDLPGLLNRAAEIHGHYCPVANGASSRKDKDDQPEKETRNLFDKAVKKREELTPEESKRFKELWGESTYRVLERPEDEIFKIETIDVPQIEYAPMFNSIQCSRCGEKVMETRIRMKNNEPVCIACAGDDYWIVAGRGIHPAK
jgi:formylmethanofuran dehydrogenase subunit E